jgi:hypothetical protein
MNKKKMLPQDLLEYIIMHIIHESPNQAFQRSSQNTFRMLRNLAILG